MYRCPEARSSQSLSEYEAAKVERVSTGARCGSPLLPPRPPKLAARRTHLRVCLRKSASNPRKPDPQSRQQDLKRYKPSLVLRCAATSFDAGYLRSTWSKSQREAWRRRVDQERALQSRRLVPSPSSQVEEAVTPDSISARLSGRQGDGEAIGHMNARRGPFTDMKLVASLLLP